MPYTFATPIEVGDLHNRIAISQLEIVSFAINIEPAHVGQGKATLSINLLDPVTSWSTNVVYRDATALAFWGQLDPAVSGALIKAVWDKLVADGKLPAGTADPQVPRLAEAQAAAASIAAAAASPATPVAVASP